MEWTIVDHNIPDCLCWAYLPEDGESIITVIQDHIMLDIESGEEVHATHYIEIEPPYSSPAVH